MQKAFPNFTEGDAEMYLKHQGGEGLCSVKVLSRHKAFPDFIEGYTEMKVKHQGGEGSMFC